MLIGWDRSQFMNNLLLNLCIDFQDKILEGNENQIEHSRGTLSKKIPFSCH